MINKPDRSLRYSIILFVILCALSYIFKNQYRILPPNYTDQDAIVAGISYPLSFLFIFVVSIAVFAVLKLFRLIRK